jgi:hypothetical protein
MAGTVIRANSVYNLATKYEHAIRNQTQLMYVEA